MTKKDMVPQKPGKEQDCRMVDSKVKGNTVSWKMKCVTKDGTVDSTGKITYHGTKFDGEETAVHKSGSEEGKMHFKISGRWVGECK